MGLCPGNLKYSTKLFVWFYVQCQSYLKPVFIYWNNLNVKFADHYGNFCNNSPPDSITTQKMHLSFKLIFANFERRLIFLHLVKFVFQLTTYQTRSRKRNVGSRYLTSDLLFLRQLHGDCYNLVVC